MFQMRARGDDSVDNRLPKQCLGIKFNIGLGLLITDQRFEFECFIPDWLEDVVCVTKHRLSGIRKRRTLLRNFL